MPYACATLRLMLGVTDLPTYLAGLLVIVLLPGPNSLYVLSVAARLARARATPPPPACSAATWSS